MSDGMTSEKMAERVRSALAIADEIDREKCAIYEAQMDSTGYGTSPHHIIKAYAEFIGKPMNGDCITEWLERWYYEKPVDDNNEPVDFGQPVDDKKRGEIEVSRVCYTRNGFYFNESHGGSKRRKMKGITYKYGERVNRPKQPVLDAKGAPIEVGDELWSIETGARYVVEKMGSNGRYEYHDMLVRDADGTIFRSMGRLYTHQEPDSQERIDEDAKKTVLDYWKCRDRCFECPSLIDGEMPSKHYGASTCTVAQRLDLLRRQRELDSKEGK